MSYPPISAYNEAIQNPSIVFQDADLKQSKPELTRLGLPLALSGGFAATYHMRHGSKSWALRCFYRDVPDRAERYAAIGRVLSSRHNQRFVSFEYLADEILVAGRRFPVVKMEWVRGSTLGLYIAENYDDHNAMKQLWSEFISAVISLEEDGIAHCDLQHGNIMVLSDGSLRFIDYDDMFVPGIKAAYANTPGHPNYRSPLRQATDFGPHVDRFSAIVLSTALQALQYKPTLWQEYSSGGDNVLFTAEDFIHPDRSRLLRDLEEIPDLSESVKAIKVLCRTPLAEIPPLSEFIRDSRSLDVAVTVSLDGKEVVLREFDVIDASSKLELLQHEGQPVEVVGKVIQVERHRGQSRDYAFINFGDWRKGTFRLIVWPDALDRFDVRGIDLHRYEGSWISVTKVVNVYNHNQIGPIPQMFLEGPSDIRLLSGEKDAKAILMGPRTFIYEGHSTVSPGIGEDLTKNEKILDEILKKHSRSVSKGAGGDSESPRRHPTRTSGSSSATVRERSSKRLTKNQELLNQILTGIDTQTSTRHGPSKAGGASTSSPRPPPGSPFATFTTQPAGARLQAYASYVKWHAHDESRAKSEVSNALKGCLAYYPELQAVPAYTEAVGRAKSPDSRRKIFAEWVVSWQIYYDRFGRLPQTLETKKVSFSWLVGSLLLLGGTFTCVMLLFIA